MATKDSSSVKTVKELKLPISRVKTIMKSSPQVESVGQDCLFLVAKATELFVHYLTKEAYKKSGKSHSLEYKHLADIVLVNETLEFLREIMPKKITVRQFKEMMAERNSQEESSSDSDSESDSESDSSSDSDKNKESQEDNDSTEESQSSQEDKGEEESSENSESDSDEDSKT